jgi:peptide/nickel transport system substrate-binding protein
MKRCLFTFSLLVITLIQNAFCQDAPVQLADEVVFFEEPSRSKAYEMLDSDQMQIYAYGLSDPDLKRKIDASANVTYTLCYGSTWELTINPAEFKNGKFNPFSVPAMREALNWLIDRNYIAQELNNGLARPKYLPIVSAFPDYARLADVCRTLEIKYGFNTEKGRAVIKTEMEKLGAKQENNKWTYKGAPVSLDFLIRTEDVRKRMGDYIATVLEDAGFTVNRQYKTAAEAAAIWMATDPADGKWDLYTGGWIATSIERDQGSTFNANYTPKGSPEPLWQAYKPSAHFADLADRLARNDFKTWDERMKMMTEALELCNQECFRVWLADAVNYFPLRKDVHISSDLAGGINGSYLWPYTVRFVNPDKHQMKIGMPSILTEPWNPVSGTNWIYDRMIIEGTHEVPVVPDPFTGLFRPVCVQSAEVTAVEGTPVQKSLDWVDVKFVPSIDVPGDTWIAWDSKEEKFLTVKEKNPEGLKARTKTVVKFAPNLFKRHFHDGTPQTLADLMLSLAIGFERVVKDSPLFDESAVPGFETFVQFFRGVRVVQEDPLVVEVYSDRFYPDAEYVAQDAITTIYPIDTLPPWQTLALGIRAESEKKLSFSADKAQKLNTERAHYLAGPSLEIFDKLLTDCQANGYIPFEKFMSKYVTKEQAKQRYAAVRSFYDKHKHFWIGNGPYYLDGVHTVEKTVVCKRFEEFRKADPQWLGLEEPRIAEVKLNVPAKVTIGSDAEFKIKVTFKGHPYPAKDIDFVKFLVFNAKGEMILSGNAEAGADGDWVAKLPAEKSKALKPGPSRLEVAVTPKVVSMPTFESAKFVSLPGAAK